MPIMEVYPMAKCTTSFSTVTYAGIDYHKKFSVVTLGDAKGAVVVSGHRLVNDKTVIKKFFADYPGIECAVESCRGYEWFIDYLKELGLTVHLSNPYKAKLIVQSRCKTDKLDSRALMQLLAIGFLPTCYQPTAEERKLRERLRWRASLVQHTTKMKIKVHALLDKENQGLGIERLFSSAGRKFLSKVPLSEPRQALLTEHMKLLEFYEESVRCEDTWVKAVAKKSPQAQMLMTIPGIGELTALLIVAELGTVKRFRNAGQVASYVGLVPKVSSSAERYSTGRLTKEGSPLLRWILNQAAWQAVKHSYEFHRHYSSVMKRCGKQAAIVSVARKLIQVAYRVLRDNKEYKAELVGRQAA
jgi:transposase